MTTPANKDLVNRIERIINIHFTGARPYFTEEKLKSLPYSVISFEFSLIERNINAITIKYIIDKKCSEKEN